MNRSQPKSSLAIIGLLILLLISVPALAQKSSRAGSDKNQPGSAPGGIKWESQNESDKRSDGHHHKSNQHHHKSNQHHHKSDGNKQQSDGKHQNIDGNNKPGSAPGGIKWESQNESDKRSDGHHHKSDSKYHDPFEE